MAPTPSALAARDMMCASMRRCDANIFGSTPAPGGVTFYSPCLHESPDLAIAYRTQFVFHVQDSR